MASKSIAGSDEVPTHVTGKLESMIPSTSTVDVNTFLARVGVEASSVALSIEFLSALHEAVMLHVPFENLDVQMGREIVLDVQRFFRKIVDQKRGGFCFELNGLLDAALRTLGFNSKKIAARVWDGERLGPERHHMALIVSVDSQQYLFDVGFGENFRRPLRLSLDEEQSDSSGTYRIRSLGEELLGLEHAKDEAFQLTYAFRMEEHDLGDFVQACNTVQTSPDSIFVQKPICSLAKSNGRVSLTRKKLIRTVHDDKQELTVARFDDVQFLLSSELGIHLVIDHGEEQRLRRSFLEDSPM